MTRNDGFTLLEVLIALAVLAIALGALIKAGSDHAAATAYLRDKTLAHWVAVDRIVELRLEPEQPAAGSRSGTVEMAGREWRWKAVVAETFDASVKRVDVSVYALGADDPLVTRVGFLPENPQ